MEDIPHPSSEPYQLGDRVQVYLDEDDVDSHHHGTEGKIHETHDDSLDENTGRELDSISYRIQTDEGDVIEMWFRHRDLVPADER